jgi:hypothetical protein
MLAPKAHSRASQVIKITFSFNKRQVLLASGLDICEQEEKNARLHVQGHLGGLRICRQVKNPWVTYDVVCISQPSRCPIQKSITS